MAEALREEVPLIELEGVRREFGPIENRTVSLDDISLTIHQGEFVAIVGPSGAGKSTLLNVLGLLDTPTAGTYRLRGEDTTAVSDRGRNTLRNQVIGFVFQDSHMILDESAMGNAALPLKVRGTAYGRRTPVISEALARLGLSHRRDERTLLLSGGERQRVAIARALSTRPAVLLADEPTGALDSGNGERVLRYLAEIHDSGVTVIVITHDPVVAAAAERRITIVDGRVADTEDDARPRRASVPDVGRTERGSFAHRLLDEAIDAVGTHTSNLARTALLLLAFILGTGGLVSAMGIAESAAAQISTRITAAGLDEVVVRSADPAAVTDGFYGADGASSRISELDGVKDVGFTSPLEEASLKVSHLPGGRTPPGIDLLTADAGYLKVMDVEVAPSQSAGLLDNGWSGRVAIIGMKAAEKLGITSPGPGEVLWVGGQPVDVIGMISDHGRSPSLDDAVVLSTAAAADADVEQPRLIVRTEIGLPAAVAAAIPLAVAPGNPESVQIETVADLRHLQRGVAGDLGSLVGAVSALLLVLACLTSAVALHLSVQARRSEIALRRAVGASRASIWRLFTIEGLAIGIGGGAAGAAVGVCAVIVVCAVNGWTPRFDPLSVVVGVVAGAASGLVASAYPAISAARADPAQAIRG